MTLKERVSQLRKQNEFGYDKWGKVSFNKNDYDDVVNYPLDPEIESLANALDIDVSDEQETDKLSELFYVSSVSGNCLKFLNSYINYFSPYSENIFDERFFSLFYEKNKKDFYFVFKGKIKIENKPAFNVFNDIERFYDKNEKRLKTFKLFNKFIYEISDSKCAYRSATFFISLSENSLKTIIDETLSQTTNFDNDDDAILAASIIKQMIADHKYIEIEENTINGFIFQSTNYYENSPNDNIIYKSDDDSKPWNNKTKLEHHYGSIYWYPGKSLMKIIESIGSSLFPSREYIQGMYYIEGLRYYDRFIPAFFTTYDEYVKYLIDLDNNKMDIYLLYGKVKGKTLQDFIKFYENPDSIKYALILGSLQFKDLFDDNGNIVVTDKYIKIELNDLNTFETFIDKVNEITKLDNKYKELSSKFYDKLSYDFEQVYEGNETDIFIYDKEKIKEFENSLENITPDNDQGSSETEPGDPPSQSGNSNDSQSGSENQNSNEENNMSKKARNPKMLKGDDVATPEVTSIIKNQYDIIIKEFITNCLEDDIVVSLTNNKDIYFIDLYYGRSNMINKMQSVANFLKGTNYDQSIKLLGFDDSSDLFGKIIYSDDSIIRYEASITKLKAYMNSINNIETYISEPDKVIERKLLFKIANKFNIPYKHEETIKTSIFEKFSENVLKLIIKNRTYMTSDIEEKLGIEYVKGVISLDVYKAREFNYKTIVPALELANKTSDTPNAKFETYKNYYEALNNFVKFLNANIISMNSVINTTSLFSGDYDKVSIKDCHEDYLILEVTDRIKYPEVFMFPANKTTLED